jgi:hypothetical protein
MRTSLFLALVTTLLAEFFLLIWRVQDRMALAVVAGLLFAVAGALWAVAIVRIRRDRR